MEQLLQIDIMKKILKFKSNFETEKEKNPVPENVIDELLTILDGLTRATDILDEIGNLTDERRSIYLKK
ncbi:hypothetical protein [Pediococcus pentosaceus]|uniref:hypothetical protein n=1 Tax=Pediococcus pentosaceus TaxID=1255 RepID=UPI00211A259E|nr:hypothetical protein [Pediococcus pentosaceus]